MGRSLTPHQSTLPAGSVLTARLIHHNIPHIGSSKYSTV